ncbi:MAG: PQQ-like beta-propeller repeat protein [Acidobacteria bacterium]|nr:PQQ-like beta-propeller repeat protein [Acidobacteriota bacterium]
MPSRRFTIAATSVAAMLAAAPARAQNWPAFRGPDGGGVGSDSAAPPVSWNVATPTNIAWKTAVPGMGHSSPIVWGNRVYVTTAVPASGTPTVVTGDVQKSGIASATDVGPHSWRLLALDRDSGQILGDREAHKGVPRMKRHVKASHASATPATDGRYIVALLGSEGLFCFDMNGTLKWRQDLGVMDVGLVDDPSMQWGPASSPVIHQNLVIVQNDRHKESFLAAYDIVTGKEAWRTTHDEYPSWATLAVVKTATRTEIVTNAGKHIRGFDAKTGQELWRLSDNNTQVKVPTPVIAGDLVIVTGGYPPGGRPIYAIRPGGSGDVGATHIAWKRTVGHRTRALRCSIAASSMYAPTTVC